MEDCKGAGLRRWWAPLLSATSSTAGHAKDEPGRTGYAKFAAALAAHYKDYDIVWEIWNEPNTMTFWGKHGKKGNTPEYAEEILRVGQSHGAAR